MSLKAIVVTEHSLDMIAAVNFGVRPEVETPRSVFIHNDDPEDHNDIVTETEFLADYWYDWNIVDFEWTEVKKH